jgi:hypothetical protein
MQITTIGLDIAKNVFQVHGIDAAEKVVVRKQSQASDADAPSQTRSCGRDIPVGSCRSVSPRTHSAMASPPQWACRGYPWPVIGA